MSVRLPLPEIRISGGELPDPAALEDVTQLLELLSQQIATYAKGTWIAVAQGLGMRNTGPGSYVGGIEAEGNVTIEINESEDGNVAVLTVEIENGSPHAQYVEEGRAAFHLPTAIDWAKTTGAIKRTSKGTPYLHIPFKHTAFATPEQRVEKGYTQRAIKRMMPAHISQMAKRLGYVRKQNVGPITRIHDTRTGETRHVYGREAQLRARSMSTDPAGRFRVANVAADRYSQPKDAGRRRLDRSHVRAQIQLGDGSEGGAEAFEERRSARGVPGSGVNPEWQSSRYHGLFKTGSRGHAQYMTIRTITPDSEGWHIPAQAGLFVAERVGRHLENDPALVQVLEGAMSAWADASLEGP